MKLVDANLLLYAVNADSPHHEPAREWLEEALSGTETVALTWPVILAFLRLSTRLAVFPQPLDVERAIQLVDSWLAQPCVVLVHPTRRHWAILKSLLAASGTGGNLATDAHLAALAQEHGAEIYSTDRDFGRFRGIAWVDPLQGA